MTDHEPEPDAVDDAEHDDQDSEPSKNAPDEGRPDLTELSEDDGEST